MASIDFATIEGLLERVHGGGRSSLLEHECYDLLVAIGAEAAPVHRLIAAGQRPTQHDLTAFSGDRVVLKVSSPDITHKTEASGVRIVARELGAVEAAHELMTRQVPEVYGRYLEAQRGARPAALAAASGRDLEQLLAERLEGVLLCSFVEADARGFATELFVGLRATAEFGPIISAGLGGVEMEILAKATVKGAAVAIAPTGMVDGESFLDLFRTTLSYQRLSGRMRGGRQLVSDDILVECFEAFIQVANHFSESNPDARFHITELEVNPFTVSGGHLAPVDGVCSFAPASRGRAPRPIHKIGHLLRPRSAAVIGVSEKSHNMGRIILNNLFDAGFDRSRVWVVRPGVTAVDGAPCVATVADLPEKVDLFVVAVSAAQVPEVVAELIDHDRANAVILIPGGLGEKEGSQALAHELDERIRRAHLSPDGGPVFLGGNSLGVISHPGRYDTMFIPELKLAKSRGERRRRSCFISQSGAYVITNLSRLPWFDPAFALSIGNQLDLRASDYLTFIKDEPEVDVIAIYMEGFAAGDGLAFARAVRDTVALGKDVVFYKAGRTSAGRSATAGHTASVAGDYAVCEAAVTQAGALVAADFGEFSDLLRLAVCLRDRDVRGRGLAALSNAGFEAVGMADAIGDGRDQLDLVALAEPTRARLQALLTEHRLDGLVDVKNPLDLTPMANDAAFAAVVDALLADPGVDALVAGIVPLTPAMNTLPEGPGHGESIARPQSIARLLPEVAARHRKPVVAVVDSGALYDPLAAALEDGGLPVFRAADRAVRTLRRYLAARLAATERRGGV